MEHQLDGKGVRDIRASLNMSPVEFALLLGVTIRTVDLRESDVVAPSRITAIVIRAAAATRRAARTCAPSAQERPTCGPARLVDRTPVASGA